MLLPEEVARYRQVLMVVDRVRRETGDPNRGAAIERTAKKLLESATNEEVSDKPMAQMIEPESAA
jgi:hypothetical protein